MHRASIMLLLLFMIVINMAGCGQSNIEETTETEESKETEEITDLTEFQDKDKEIVSDDIEEAPSINISITAVLNTQSEPVILFEEDALVVIEVLKNGAWNNEATADCFNNCMISVNDDKIYYHSECGTFNDKVNSRHLVLDSETRVIINNIFAKYTSLDVIETPM